VRVRSASMRTSASSATLRAVIVVASVFDRAERQLGLRRPARQAAPDIGALPSGCTSSSTSSPSAVCRRASRSMTPGGAPSAASFDPDAGGPVDLESPAPTTAMLRDGDARPDEPGQRLGTVAASRRNSSMVSFAAVVASPTCSRAAHSGGRRRPRAAAELPTSRAGHGAHQRSPRRRSGSTSTRRPGPCLALPRAA